MTRRVSTAPPLMRIPSLRIAAIYAVLFGTGFILMGYEMLSSRYLNPFYGGGIATWATIISTVLLAMMAGYFAGGEISRRYERLDLATAACCFATALCLLLVYLWGRDAIEWLSLAVGDELFGLLVSASFLLFLPVALISALSPIAIQMMTVSLEESGRVAGAAYAVSTFGNVLGTYVTVFYMIPAFGSTAITGIFTVATVVFGGIALWTRSPAQD